jgi:Spy/CpxP family protein refolding chaperone
MRITNKWNILAAALAVFILGFLAGALSMNLYRHRRGDFRGDDFRGRIEKLNLTPDQKTQVEGIYNDTRGQLREVKKESWPKVAEIRKQARTRLQAVLTPEQWKQLEEMEKNDRRPGEPGER